MPFHACEMNRYRNYKSIVLAVVFIVTSLGSIWLFREQITTPETVFPPLPIFATSRFTRIGKVPSADGPRCELQFINENEGWLARGRDLWQTQDGGQTWELVHQLPSDSPEQFYQLQFINSKHGWANILNELYKSDDGGRTWSRVVTPISDGYGNVRAFHLTENSGWIAGGMYRLMKPGDGCMNNATGTLTGLGSACLNGAVFRTDDGGASWQEQRIPQHPGRFMSITFTDSDHVWVAGDAGVFHTADGGQTWSSDEFRRECEDYYELPDRHPASTFFVANKVGWLVLSSGQIARSTDGGQTWCDLFDPENLWRPDPGYVGPTRQFDSIHFRDANYGVGLGFDRLMYETVDGGATWKREGTLVRFATVVFSDSSHGWAISMDNELYRVQLGEVARDLIPPREEPRQLIDIFTDEHTLSYKGYEIRKLTEKVDDEGKLDLEVSYAVLMKNKRRLLKFAGVYFGMGNDTEFGLFDLLGQDAEQIIVSQTVPRGGRHWVVSVSPEVRVLFDSWDYGAGREEFYVIDIDKDGVYEIVLPVTAFYAMQDKMYIGEIPLPEIIFKYDAKARRYLPANDRFADYALHGIERDIEKLRSEDDSNYLSRRLRILLRYLYARKQREGWSFFARAYQRSDRKRIVARIRSVLKDDPVYNYLY